MTSLAYGLNPVSTAQVDDDCESVLDDNILERPAPALAMDHRRDGFSPRENWPDFTFSTEHMNTTFFDQGTNPFVAQDVPQGVVYGNQPSVWREGDGGSCTPTTAYEAYPSYHGLPVGTSAPFNPGAALSTSSQSGQDWSSISSTDQMDLRSMPKQEPLSSPTYNPNPPLMRRDGIRKKNARFEIPAERTLRTIDHLINQTNDEQEIKELKQQKRLLRNRQAAYV